MRTIAPRLPRPLADPGSVLSVILGVFVGALFGVHYEPRTPITPSRLAGAGHTWKTGTISIAWLLR